MVVSSDILTNPKGGIKEKMKNFRRSKKALSPVVASIILIAVTVAVSIAVAVWMGALSVGFMQTEQLSITNVQFSTGTDQVISVNVTNTGTNAITITTVTVTPIPSTAPTVAYPTGFTPGTSTLPANTIGSITLTVTGTSGLYTNGGSYKVTILTSKGNTFSYTAVAA